MSMKTSGKFLATAASLLFLGAVSNASAVGRFTMGVKGGLNLVQPQGQERYHDSSFRTRGEFVWGGFIEYRISGLFSVQAEVLDSPKGSKLLSGLTGTREDITLMYEYTEVPLLIKWAQGFGSRWIPSLYAGPYWAHLREASITDRRPAREYHRTAAGSEELRPRGHLRILPRLRPGACLADRGSAVRHGARRRRRKRRHDDQPPGVVFHGGDRVLRPGWLIL